MEEGAGDDSPTKKKAAGKEKGGLEERRLQGVFICCGKAFNSTSNVPAGNICAFSGIDQYVAKRSCLASNKEAFPLRGPTFNVSPVVRVSVAPKEAKDLPKAVEGLKR